MLLLGCTWVIIVSWFVNVFFTFFLALFSTNGNIPAYVYKEHDEYVYFLFLI